MLLICCLSWSFLSFMKTSRVQLSGYVLLFCGTIPKLLDMRILNLLTVHHCSYAMVCKLQFTQQHLMWQFHNYSVQSPYIYTWNIFLVTVFRVCYVHTTQNMCERQDQSYEFNLIINWINILECIIIGTNCMPVDCDNWLNMLLTGKYPDFLQGWS